MSERAPLPFAAQRLVFFALLLGMTMYAIVVAVMLQTSGGKGLAEAPIPQLEVAAVVVGAVSAVVGLALRGGLQRSAAATTGTARSHARFRATLIPLAMLEGGCLFALTVWLLNGAAVPALVVGLVLLSLAIALVPFQDPDAGA
jgi:hypothetical protein